MRTFVCPDGTLIEVRSDQALQWNSNTCLCQIVFEQDTLDYDFSIQNCRVHSNLPDSQIIQRALQMNQQINSMFGDTMDKTKLKLIAEDRVQALKNNKALGTAIIKADKNTKDSIESYLRSQGR